MKIEVQPDDDGVARKAAAIIAADARAAVPARGRFIMAVSGGRTPWLMLRALADEQLPWENVHVFQVDERVAPAADPDRNLTHLRESLLDHAPLRPDHVHAMPVETADLDRAAGQYALTLQEVAGSPPVLDLVHLGLGPDGHTASLVPGDPVLDITDADVAVTGPYQGRRRMTSDLPDHQPVPARAVAGDRRREGRNARAPARRRSIHSGVACASGSGGDPRRSCGGRAARHQRDIGGEKMSAIAGAAVDSPMTNAQLDQLSINCIRTLSIDAVQQAKSGHPGTPMALAPLVYTLWNRVMRFDPKDPIWPNRDRFVLSNGHASMLLWSVLFLTGTRAVNAAYERLGEPAVSLDDIRHFRQLGSKAPGHPEYHWVSGVEATTGPLGQGVATSVGMAIAETWLANRYNRPGFEIFGYNIYAVCGDGCMMEGVGSEAASLAGHLGLDNLCWIYDNNHITIEGNTRIAFTEDIAARFMGYGWNVLRVGDANDIDRIEQALDIFHKTKGRPTFIILDSHIGYGSPHKQDTAAAHGEPLGEEEVRLTKRDYGWPEDAKFLVPDGVREHFAAGIGARGAQAHGRWTELFTAYRSKYPELATEIDLMQRRELPAGWDSGFPSFRPTPRASPDGMPRAKCSTCLHRTSHGWSADRRISARPTRPP